MERELVKVKLSDLCTFASPALAPTGTAEFLAMERLMGKLVQVFLSALPASSFHCCTTALSFPLPSNSL